MRDPSSTKNKAVELSKGTPTHAPRGRESVARGPDARRGRRHATLRAPCRPRAAARIAAYMYGLYGSSNRSTASRQLSSACRRAADSHNGDTRIAHIGIRDACACTRHTGYAGPAERP